MTDRLAQTDDPCHRLFQAGNPCSEDLEAVFRNLCQPLPASGRPRVIAQLGQSLDGRIATVTGCSRFINGEDGLTHLHRIRALCDAVVVGAGTALADNPRLTVRRVHGPQPVRVVIDRHRRVPQTHHLFTDGEAPTLRLVAGDYRAPEQPPDLEGVQEVPCLADDARLCPHTVLRVMADYGLMRVFVEGGGVTVSSFLHAGLIDSLHVLVAPMIIGSGRPAFSLPEIDQLDDALRPNARCVNLGSDMLFALDFPESGSASMPEEAGAATSAARAGSPAAPSPRS